MKTKPGSSEFDEKYLHNNTGWFIYSPSSRNAEVARFLGIPYVYCVGQYPGKTRNPEVVFIQPSRSIDPRTNKVEYLVVNDFEDICNVVDIIRRPVVEQEVKEIEYEGERDMQLAMRGLL